MCVLACDQIEARGGFKDEMIEAAKMVQPKIAEHRSPIRRKFSLNQQISQQLEEVRLKGGHLSGKVCLKKLSLYTLRPRNLRLFFGPGACRCLMSFICLTFMKRLYALTAIAILRCGQCLAADVAGSKDDPSLKRIEGSEISSAV